MISNIIKFVHEDKILEVKNPDPNETLLNFIRTKLKIIWMLNTMVNIILTQFK